METISEILEVKNYLLKREGAYDFIGDGYKIVTNEQEILFLISNGQNCCEEWGYMISQDDFNDFIGAEITGIRTVNESLESKPFEEYLDCGGVIFINVETNKGVLQFTLYNGHNGYYGHDVKIVSNQLKHEDCL